ncbi:hypothetical protein GQ43DRAFT_76812 [Delitschia confertaspora ATCC 74209]|uniref:Rhodopsin domain-containing protein n=1 Tax=Delitschia confertaspora ATCC 74209 TaxID=1513339 RepID=A0A9P4JLD2_9PLEO|nr:hypothetical protein GQ43DRAFT_76812 [Delitschia confertaspora ATCC 74209]
MDIYPQDQHDDMSKEMIVVFTSSIPAALPLARFQTLMWIFCGIATAAVMSRIYVRFATGGRLMVNDYFVVLALPILFTGAGLLQSTLLGIYSYESLTGTNSHQMHGASVRDGTFTKRFIAALDMAWIAIYCVKFAFIASFKFHKPPYAYVSAHLTRYYWFIVGGCVTTFILTLVGQAVVCPGAAENCPFLDSFGQTVLGMLITGLDIMTDIFVVSIPALVIQMAHMTKSQTAIYATFRCLSVFMIAIGISRLVIQYDAQNHRINYIWSAFWLFMEAAIALIMASISSWRRMLFDPKR